MSTRKMTKRMKGAFTLVELLVVIGIIALLIAILMPALSRARKQALAASCGSNARQIIYAAAAYANDWKQQLPTMNGAQSLTGWGDLTRVVRLPTIGFDTGTIWDMGTYFGYSGMGGWGFMMRDYLKNDFDVSICPDGWYDATDLLVKWNGTGAPSFWGGANAGQTLYLDQVNGGHGYLWLPHRLTAQTTCLSSATAYGGPYPMADKPRDVAKTASGKPELLILVDFNRGQVKFQGGYTGQPCIASNHSGTEVRHLAFDYQCNVWPAIIPNNMGANNPEDMPLGSNQGRIDARVTWKAFQDWTLVRFCHGANNTWYAW